MYKLPANCAAFFVFLVWYTNNCCKVDTDTYMYRYIGMWFYGFNSTALLKQTIQSLIPFTVQYMKCHSIQMWHFDDEKLKLCTGISYC